MVLRDEKVGGWGGGRGESRKSGEQSQGRGWPGGGRKGSGEGGASQGAAQGPGRQATLGSDILERQEGPGGIWGWGWWDREEGPYGE